MFLHALCLDSTPLVLYRLHTLSKAADGCMSIYHCLAATQLVCCHWASHRASVRPSAATLVPRIPYIRRRTPWVTQLCKEITTMHQGEIVGKATYMTLWIQQDEEERRICRWRRVVLNNPLGMDRSLSRSGVLEIIGDTFLSQGYMAQKGEPMPLPACM